MLAADDPAVLDHALKADNTRVDRGNPGITALSIGYRPLDSRPRAAAGAQRLRASTRSRQLHLAQRKSGLRAEPDVPSHTQ